MWSNHIELSFDKLQSGEVNSMKSYLEKSVALLTDLIKMVYGELSASLRQKVICLITLNTL